ncbi:MAG: thioredoxin family protein [Actinomycetota bacterium]|nr:thioredoxin family protein [Actinomycetota bacterium]
MDATAVIAVAALIVAFASLFVAAGVAARVAELQRELHEGRSATLGESGLLTASLVPDAVANDIDGKPVDWAELRAGPTMLVVGSPECPPCNQLVDDLPLFRSRNPDWDTVILAGGAEDRVRERYGGSETVVIRAEDFSAADRFRPVITPYVFILQEGRVIHQGGANTVEDLERLIRHTTPRRAEAASTAVG